MTAHIVQGNALNMPYASGIAQTCVTSPPYYGLRDYGVDGQIGLEQTPAEYVAQIVAVMREVWRVLRDDGTLWLNLGDSYAGGGNYRGVNSEDTLTSKQNSNRGARGLSQKLGAKQHDVKDKDLLGIPWRVAFALQDDGWYLRSDIIWHKPNPMPESVTDRPTKSHEYVFLLTKQARYFYDAEAVKDDGVATENRGGNQNMRDAAGIVLGRKESPNCGLGENWKPSGKRNARTVWTIATRPYSGAHFATMPPALAERCILAGSSDRACPTCGRAWERVVERVSTGKRYSTEKSATKNAAGLSTAFSGYDDGSSAPAFTTIGHRPACACYGVDLAQPPAAFLDLPTVPSIVLDPFTGSGTTAREAAKHRRRFIGTELNPAYIALTPDRVTVQTQF